MNSEFLPVVKCTIDNTLDQWLQGNNSIAPFVFLSYTGTQVFLFWPFFSIGKQDKSEYNPEWL